MWSKMAKPAGYIAANKTTGKVTVMLETPPGTKNYAQADLQDVLEVVTGRRANVALYWKK